jgi:hypothetical protein
MKLVQAILFYITIFLSISMIFVESRAKSKRSGVTYTRWVRPLIKTAKSYLSFANLAYCKPDIINALSCPLCHQVLDKSFKLKHYEKQELDGRTYQFVALVSDTHNEVVVSFSGPKSSDANFYGSVYQSGFATFKGESIENAFLNVYTSKIQQPLTTFFQTLLADGIRNNYKFIFIGHSFGGSIAVLAAFDLVESGIIKTNSSINSPLVYSYGQLRIGNDRFVEKVNTLFKVIRIVKATDPMTRLPNCAWSPALKKWRCYRDTYNLYLTFPEYRRYITDYSGRGQFKQYAAQAKHARSFLETSSKSLSKRSKSKRKGYYYAMNNPGYKTYSYGSTLTNQGSLSYGNVYYSQPLGSEVIFSNNFKHYRVCSYFNGIPNCEKQLPASFEAEKHAKYYNENIEEC